MAKRGAEEQITKDGTARGSHDYENSTPIFASSDVLARRKILKPRGKMFNLQTKPSPGFCENDPDSIEREEKLKALGISFSNSVKKVNVDEGVADFRPLANKYIRYYQEIESGSRPKPIGAASNFEPAGQKIGSFNASSHLFQSSTVPTKEPIAQVSQSRGTSASDDDSDKGSTKNVKIQGPQFNLSTKPTTNQSPFTFEARPASKMVELDSGSEIEIKGPTFTFNKQIQDPIFKLSGKEMKARDEMANQINNATSGAFSFGSNITKFNTEDEKNSIPDSNTASSFSDNRGQKEIAVGNISSTSLAPTSFEFGLQQSKSKDTKEGAPIFSFNDGSHQTAIGIKGNYGTHKHGNDNNNPLFSVDSASKSTESKANYNSGNNSANRASGSDNPTNISDSVPSAFNSTTGLQNTNVQVPNLEDVTPSGNNMRSATDTETAGDLEDNPNIEFDAVASLNNEKLDTATGEESETVVFQRKTKLMSFNPDDKENIYKTLGKGELKVLHSDEKGTSRILIRADGSLRVLLNVSIIRNMSYSVIGNGSFVRVPVANENKIDTYVLKVRTAEDGQELCKVLNDLKSR